MKLIEVFKKKDNALSLISIILVLVILVADVFGDGFTQPVVFEVILVILALLSLSQIIEREARFERVYDGLSDVSQKLVEMQRPQFVPISSIPKFEDIMQNGQELFYTGGHLHSFIHMYSNHFRAWMKEGKSLRLILQNPDNKGLRDLRMPCINYEAEVYVAQINDSLKILKAIKDEFPAGRLGVRVTDIAPTQSVAIIDGNIGGNMMSMLHHLPNGESGTAPFSIIDPLTDNVWFELFYERYYIYLWENSKPVIVHPDDA